MAETSGLVTARRAAAGDEAPAAVWPPFVQTALWIALVGGFGLGGALFAALLLGLPLGPWWRAAAQAHGHAQLFGWLGLMVLGVGVHFLPRLRGAPLAWPGLAPLALRVLAGGVVARLVSAPLVALQLGGPAEAVLRAALVAAAGAELAGILALVVLLGATLGRGPPLDDRVGARAVLPFFLVGFPALAAAAATSFAGTVEMVRGGDYWLPAWATFVSYSLALELFVLPLCVGMSARTFPLFFRTPLPRLGILRGGLVLLVAGVLAGLAGQLGGLAELAAAGSVAQGLALLSFVVGLGILAPARPLPRDPVPRPIDPARLHGQAAYGWLALAGLLRLASGLDRLGLVDAGVHSDAELHLLGAGFATVLVFGVGVPLLSGFAGGRTYDRRLLWATLLLGNAAALARVGPYLWPGALPAAVVYGLFAAAGLLGLAAVAAFRANLALGARARQNVTVNA